MSRLDLSRGRRGPQGQREMGLHRQRPQPDQADGEGITTNVRLPKRPAPPIDAFFTPAPVDLVHPAMLDLPAGNVCAYPVATTVAQKVQAMVELGIRHSRMKDFFDLWAIALTMEVDGVADLAMPAATGEAVGKRWRLGGPWA